MTFARRWRAEAAQGRDGRCGFGKFLNLFLRSFAGDFCDKAAHAKSFRMVRVEQFHCADFLLAHNAGDAGEGQFQLFGLGRGREKKSSLRRARAGRLGGEMNFHDWCSRGMRVEIKLQKFQKDFGVEHGKRQVQFADEFWLTAVERSFAPPDSRGRLSPHVLLCRIIILVSIAFAGDACIFGFVVDAGEVGEFQREAKLLCCQCA